MRTSCRVGTGDTGTAYVPPRQHQSDLTAQTQSLLLPLPLSNRPMCILGNHRSLTLPSTHPSVHPYIHTSVRPYMLSPAFPPLCRASPRRPICCNSDFDPGNPSPTPSSATSRKLPGSFSKSPANGSASLPSPTMGRCRLGEEVGDRGAFLRTLWRG